MSMSSQSLVSLMLVLLCFPAGGQAQIVEVESGRVRAPFVRVYRTPDGGTRVRAPFVDVMTDGTRGPRAANGPHDVPLGQLDEGHAPVPSAATDAPPEMDVTEANWQSLRTIVRAREGELESQLDHYRDAERWKARLHVGSLRQILTAESNRPPAGDTRDRLQVVLNAYDHASTNAAFRPLTRLGEFHAVHSALRELLRSPLERQRGRLATAALDLDETLAGVQNGSSWAKYLRLPESVFSAHDVVADGQANELSDVLERFASVTADRRYSVIAGLPAFQATHRHLADYIALLNQGASPLAEVPPPPWQPELSGGISDDGLRKPRGALPNCEITR